MNKKLNPWSVANLHCECQELKPKVQSNSSFLVVRILLDVDTVNTVGSHLKVSDFELLFPNSCCELGQLIPYAFIFSKNICNVDLDIDQHFFELLKACFGDGDFGSCDRWFFSCKLLILYVFRGRHIGAFTSVGVFFS